MSRHGKCVNNSLIETFFEHMKNEINFSTIRTYEEVEYVINRYINYYNTNRPQWKLKKMTPEKYRNHLLGVAYPLFYRTLFERVHFPLFLNCKLI